jgi:hypothetical protein
MTWSRAISTALLLLSIVVVAYLTLGHQTLPFTATFAMQAAAIVSVWFQLRRLRRQKGVNWIQSLSAGLKVVLVALAAAGIALTLLEVGSLLSGNTPSGGAITSVRWNSTGSGCHVIYNTDVHVERPLAACAELDRNIGLAFAGGWVLVAAIGLWLAFMRPRS